MSDSYDRNGPPVFVKEYPRRRMPGLPTGQLANFIGWAAFMTGMERSSDIVHMRSSAPLFPRIAAAPFDDSIRHLLHTMGIASQNIRYQHLSCFAALRGPGNEFSGITY